MTSAPAPAATGIPITPITLRRVPACFGLPSADPRALAAETMLRIVQARYSKTDARYRDLAMVVPPRIPHAAGSAAPFTNTQTQAGAPITAVSKAAPVTVRGVEAVVSSLSSTLDAEVIPNDLRPAAVCVEALATRCLFPAFVFLTFYDFNAYQGAVAKSVKPKIATLWESIRGTFRDRMLRENPYFFADVSTESCGSPPSSGTPSLVQMGVMTAVLEEVSRALRSLELLHVAHAAAGESFFLGTARPCSVDAYAYAAVSAFLHADFGSPVGGTDPSASAEKAAMVSPVLAKFQQRARGECPLLLRYVEKVRTLVFADYAGTYNLKPVTVSDDIERTAAEKAVEDMYVRGRFTTLLWTGVFAFCYFVVANADLLAAMAEEVVEKLEEEEAAAEAQEAAAAETSVKR